ncbi:hypothetical protein D3C85_700560 [compost metagenome]
MPARRIAAIPVAGHTGGAEQRAQADAREALGDGRAFAGAGRRQRAFGRAHVGPAQQQVGRFIRQQGLRQRQWHRLVERRQFRRIEALPREGGQAVARHPFFGIQAGQAGAGQAHLRLGAHAFGRCGAARVLALAHQPQGAGLVRQLLLQAGAHLLRAAQHQVGIHHLRQDQAPHVVAHGRAFVRRGLGGGDAVAHAAEQVELPAEGGVPLHRRGDVRLAVAALDGSQARAPGLGIEIHRRQACAARRLRVFAGAGQARGGDAHVVIVLPGAFHQLLQPGVVQCLPPQGRRRAGLQLRCAGGRGQGRQLRRVECPRRRRRADAAAGQRQHGRRQ